MTRKEYIKANHAWLAAKAKEEGVRKIAPGVYARTIREGDASRPSPTPGSIVTVHYTGRTIDGKTFDTSRTSPDAVPAALRVRDLIDGWQAALPRMHPGDTWELFIAAEAGYGTLSMPGIPGGSTLIFELELTGVA